MYKDSIRIHLTCPRHPRYSPRQSIGAIKAGCPRCFAMHKVWMAARELRESIQLYEEELTKWESSPARAKK